MDLYTNDNKGFSLIEALVAVVIMGVISLGIATAITTQNKQISQAALRLETLDINNSLNNILSNESMCLNNLKSLKIDLSDSTKKYTLPSLSTYNNSNVELQKIITAGEKSPGNNNLTIEEISISNAQKISADEGYVKFTVSFSSPMGPLRSLSFNLLNIKIDSANNVTFCSLNPSFSSSLAKLLEGVQAFETKTCINDHSGTNRSLVATCGSGYKLLSCLGSPGDQTENDEGWRVSPNFAANTCTLHFQSVAWRDTGIADDLQHQQIIAFCFKSEN